jgi:lysophospholipase L1-like esterase
MGALSRRKKIAFAMVTVVLAASLFAVLLLAADLVLHYRAERSAGLNRWGYRGPVVGAKQRDETRLVLLGGSTVFGYGVSWDEAIPAQLERKLRARFPHRRVTVVNLGFNNEASYSFLPTLEDYEYLDYDAVVLYEGYNDAAGDAEPNTAVFRRRSSVFRLTGYMPILPLYLQEKAMLIRHGGDLSRAYAAGRGEQPTVFRPNLAERTSAAVLEGAAAVSASLGRQLGRWQEEDKARPVATSTLGCRSPWMNYCENVHRAVTSILNDGKSVLVVGQPQVINEHRQRLIEQQAEMSGMLQRRFAGNSRVRYLDLGGALNLADTAMAYDGMHLTAAGNEIIAERLVEPVSAIAGLQ